MKAAKLLFFLYTIFLTLIVNPTFAMDVPNVENNPKTPTKEKKRKRIDDLVSEHKIPASDSITDSDNCPLMSGTYVCSKGKDRKRKQFKLEIDSAKRAGAVRYRFRYSKSGTINKFDIGASACQVLSKSSSSIQRTAFIRNDVLGEGVDLDEFTVESSNPDNLIIRHSKTEYDDGERDIEQISCQRSGDVSPDLQNPKSIIKPTDFVLEKVQKIDEEDALSIRHCSKATQENSHLLGVLENWRKDPKATLGHKVQIGSIFGSLHEAPSETTKLEGVFSVCNREGEIISIGIIDENKGDNTVHLDNLVSNPSHQQKGGGRSVIKYVLKRSILNSQDGVTLISTDESREFYFKMGFVSSFDDFGAQSGRFYLDVTEMLQKFPEFTEALKVSQDSHHRDKGATQEACESSPAAPATAPIAVPPTTLIPVEENRHKNEH